MSLPSVSIQKNKERLMNLCLVLKAMFKCLFCISAKYSGGIVKGKHRLGIEIHSMSMESTGLT